MTTDAFLDAFTDPQALCRRVSDAARALSLPQTQRVLPLALQWHEGQLRKGARPLPYITHPLSTACHALSLSMAEDDLLAALLLHDVLEDTPHTADELPVSPAVREAVTLVTKTPGYNNRDYYAAIAENRLATLVKLFDRCHNLSCMASGFSRDKMAAYVRETEEYLLPLLDALPRRWPQHDGPAWALQYQMLSLMNAVRRLL